MKMPCNLLVKGDIVLCAAGEAAPGEMRCLDDGCEDIHVGRGVVVEPHIISPYRGRLYQRQKYILEETPLVGDVVMMMQARQQQPKSWLANELTVIGRWVCGLVGILMGIALVVNIVRYVALAGMRIVAACVTRRLPRTNTRGPPRCRPHRNLGRYARSSPGACPTQTAEFPWQSPLSTNWFVLCSCMSCCLFYRWSLR